MDKRYLLIILIICVCFVNLFMITNVSDIVGNASVDAGNYTFSLPKGFSMYDDTATRVQISNPDTKMNIWFFSELGKNDTFINKYHEIDQGKGFNVLSNGTIKDNDINIDSVFYQSTEDSSNRSTFYFTKDGHDFRILVEGFDYNTQKEEVSQLVVDIIESIRINHKHAYNA